jgi:hypothetical protein
MTAAHPQLLTISPEEQGFVPADQQWIGQNELVVTYVRQDTPAAPGPQRGLALLDSVLLGVVVAFVVWLLLGLVTLLVGPIVGALVAVRRSRRSEWVSFIVMFVAVSAIWLVVVLALAFAVWAALMERVYGG